MVGKVKTRLAATIGSDAALQVYKNLLIHTHAISKNLSIEKYIYYENYINGHDLWENEIYNKRLQEGDDLGERMSNAFAKIFDDGYHSAIIIGSDCFELTGEIIEEAIGSLGENDLVIGPAADGGYYLLGMKTYHPQLFREKKWSSDSVFNDTHSQAVDAGLSIMKLPLLTDVDHEKDLPAL